MARESGFDSGSSYCGNCGTPLDSGSLVCGSCGTPVGSEAWADQQDPRDVDEAPVDYIPYCRNCGVGVPWGQGHSCNRCGVTPLCALHFSTAEGLCLDCANTQSFGGTAPTTGLRCGACGAPVAPMTDFCPNCGRGLAAPYQRMEYAGFLLRSGAFIVDWIFGYLVAALVAAIIGISMTSGDIEPTNLQDVSITLENFNYSFLLLFCVISAVHGVILTIWRGQTVGKMVLKIQVVDANGNLPPWHKSLIRELLRGVILLALLPLGLLYFWVLFDPRKRGPHDLVSGSFVVRKQGGAKNPGSFF